MEKYMVLKVPQSIPLIYKSAQYSLTKVKKVKFTES